MERTLQQGGHVPNECGRKAGACRLSTPAIWKCRRFRVRRGPIHQVPRPQESTDRPAGKSAPAAPLLPANLIEDDDLARGGIKCLDHDRFILDGWRRAFEEFNLGRKHFGVGCGATKDELSAVSINAAPVDIDGAPSMPPFPFDLSGFASFGSSGIGFCRQYMDPRFGIEPAMT